ncbi:hypothetical protein BKH46_02840 [Helicobacter sp. 12S02634-8]|uniref:alpha/beta fold hydrolase n=1 Tax=Helicobacter sp. 12S02634-8 TaxID=1476199 RepID=UPI000BA5952D|nr:alpha/beta hydrolase [Helicobacter sp. 12S02634-8]PAF47788.1 hypothetical protein BKH46_02840 [Helicobacter sp. 12S02634-8]
MKITKNLSFSSDFGSVFYDKYIPDCPKNVVIQIAHGMIEHKERYVWLCEMFAAAGYVVFIHDHRGHGDSIGGDVWHGEMGRDGFEKALMDMAYLRGIIATEFPSSALVLLGHSMGSLLARRFLQCYEERLDALILSGTPSPYAFLGVGVVFFRLLDTFGIRTCPKISTLFALNSKLKWLKKGKSHRHKTHWLCSDSNVVGAYLQDPKTHFNFTPNSFANLLLGIKKVFSPYPHKPTKPHLPILFLSGTEDICGEYGKGAQKAYTHLVSQGYDNVILKLWEGASHEVFNEPNKEEILAHTLLWLKNQGL